jgi:hypothetical protein
MTSQDGYDHARHVHGRADAPALVGVEAAAVGTMTQVTAESVIIAGLRQRCAEFGLTTTGDESIEELQEALGYLRAASEQELVELPNDDQPEDG